MTPADQSIPEAKPPFAIRRQEEPGREVVHASASLSDMDALRARVHAQSRQVAAHIENDPDARAFIDTWATPGPINC